LSSTPVLQVKNLRKSFCVSGMNFFKKKYLPAVSGASFDVFRGETFGLVGESGAGKSILTQLIACLIPADSGEILFEGENLRFSSKDRMKQIRREIQVVFQDSFTTLNPLMRGEELLSEPFLLQRIYSAGSSGLAKKVKKLLDYVQLPLSLLKKYPHECSSGQRQRLSIARAIALKPKLLLADEPVSSLDVLTQAQILSLFCTLKKEFSLSLLLISHDLSVIYSASDRIGVMKKGRLLEVVKKTEFLHQASHPYTKALIEAVPKV